jgi:hypothetical protein
MTVIDYKSLFIAHTFLCCQQNIKIGASKDKMGEEKERVGE